MLQKLDLVLEKQHIATEKLVSAKRKDLWDKIQASGALLVGFVGILFTFVYQASERERAERSRIETDRIQQLQLVTQMLPALTGDDQEQRAIAIRMIESLPHAGGLRDALQRHSGRGLVGDTVGAAGRRMFNLYEDIYGRAWAGGTCTEGWCARIVPVFVADSAADRVGAAQVPSAQESR